MTVRLLRTDGACCGTGAHLKVRTWLGQIMKRKSGSAMGAYPGLQFFFWPCSNLFPLAPIIQSPHVILTMSGGSDYNYTAQNIRATFLDPYLIFIKISKYQPRMYVNKILYIEDERIKI